MTVSSRGFLTLATRSHQQANGYRGPRVRDARLLGCFESLRQLVKVLDIVPIVYARLSVRLLGNNFLRTGCFLYFKAYITYQDEDD